MAPKSTTRTQRAVLKALEGFHEAQRKGDVERMMDAFTDMPQGATNGVPRPMEALRAHFTDKLASFKARRADMRRAAVVVDPTPESFWRYRDGKRIHPRGCALVSPVRYTKTGGVGVGPSNGDAPGEDTIFVMYTMVQWDDGKWRIAFDRLLPDPDGEAYDRDLLTDAGRVLDRSTMVWTRKLDAAVKDVWRAVSTRKGLTQWWLGRDKSFRIELKVGGTFQHHWASTIHQLEKGRLIDFDEFRIELEPDGEGTRLTFVVHTMNGDEWRAFWQVEEAPIFYAQLGGLDPWAAAGWHMVLDRLDEVVTGRPVIDAHERWAWLPNARRRQFYLVYLRELHRLNGLARAKKPLQRVGAAPSEFGLPRTDKEYPPPKPPPTVKPPAIDQLELRSQPALVLEGKTVAGDYLNAVARGVPKVMAYMAKEGIEPVGRPFMRCMKISVKESTRTLQYAVGFPIPEARPGAGKVKAHALPAGAAVSMTFTGSYEQLLDRWQDVAAHARSLGADLPDDSRAIAGGWHIFVNDPREVGLERAESQLVLPLESA